MFKNAFQNGPAVEILQANDKSPLFSISKSNWKVYDRNVKGNIILLDTHTAKLSIPASEKQSLSITQPFLVLQIFIVNNQPFSLELVLTDVSSTKRRIVFSSVSKELTSTPLHARVPNCCFVRGVWANISIDLCRAMQACFGLSTFRSLDAIVISSFCRLKRVFSMKNALWDDTEAETRNSSCETVPKTMDFPAGVECVNQRIWVDDKKTEAETEKKTSEKERRPPLTTGVVRKGSVFQERTASVGRKQSKNRSLVGKETELDKSGRINTERKENKIAKKKKIVAKHLSISGEEKKNCEQECKENKQQIVNRNESEKEKRVDFGYLTNYKDYQEVMHDSIEEEIENESEQQEIKEDIIVEENHNYYPQEEIEEEPKLNPCFFANEVEKAMKFRPYTPPFMGLESRNKKRRCDKENEDKVKELVFDPVLNCYFDPNSQDYYQMRD
jgi:hypothetical protein